MSSRSAKPVTVTLGLRALDDLNELHVWISKRAGFDIADGYLARLEARCQSLRTVPERGTRRDNLVPGLRSIPFERRATVAYTIAGQVVNIQRVLYSGRNLSRAFED